MSNFFRELESHKRKTNLTAKIIITSKIKQLTSVGQYFVRKRGLDCSLVRREVDDCE